VGAYVGGEVIGAAEAFATLRKVAKIRSLLCVDELVTLEMLKALEVPTTRWVVADMFVCACGGVALTPSTIEKDECFHLSFV
jgi:hypothetical protein